MPCLQAIPGCSPSSSLDFTAIYLLIAGTNTLLWSYCFEAGCKVHRKETSPLCNLDVALAIGLPIRGRLEHGWRDRVEYRFDNFCFNHLAESQRWNEACPAHHRYPLGADAGFR